MPAAQCALAPYLPSSHRTVGSSILLMSTTRCLTPAVLASIACSLGTDVQTTVHTYHCIPLTYTQYKLYIIYTPYSPKFYRRTIFVDWRFQKFRGNNFRGPRIPLASVRYSKILRSLIFEVRCRPRKTRKLRTSKIRRYMVYVVRTERFRLNMHCSNAFKHKHYPRIPHSRGGVSRTYIFANC